MCDFFLTGEIKLRVYLKANERQMSGELTSVEAELLRQCFYHADAFSLSHIFFNSQIKLNFALPNIFTPREI